MDEERPPPSDREGWLRITRERLEREEAEKKTKAGTAGPTAAKRRRCGS
jgi:hypothetical protein